MKKTEAENREEKKLNRTRSSTEEIQYLTNGTFLKKEKSIRKIVQEHFPKLENLSFQMEGKHQTPRTRSEKSLILNTSEHWT